MLKPRETCIAKLLKDAGFSSGYIGKRHLDGSELNFSPHPKSGAGEWDAYTPPGERRQGFDYFLSYGACDDHLDPHYWLDDETQIKPGKWSAEFETDKAIEYMNQKKDGEEPFALFVSYNPPHLPYELVPERYYEKFKNLKVHYRPNVPESMREEGGLLETQTRQYFAAVHGIDEQFGRILAWLKENGMEEKTLVVLSADHGEMLGEHSIWEKQRFYEGSVRVPFFIRYPRRFAPGRCRKNVNLIDIYATLCELCGSPAPEGLESRSLTGLLEGRGEDWLDETISQWGGRNLMIKNGNLKYHYYGDDGSELLFDLEKDPEENRDFGREPGYEEQMAYFRRRREEIGF